MITTKREQRLKYLGSLYDMVGGSPLRTANHHDIPMRAEISHQCAKDAFYYLQSEGLLQAQNPEGVINITHQGVKEYEAAMARSNRELVQYPRSLIANNVLHNSFTIDETVSLYGNPTDHLSPAQMVRTVPHRPKGVFVVSDPEGTKISPETDMVIGEIQSQERKPKKHLIIAVMRNLKRALTNTLFETGVRFLLSKLGRLM